MCSFFHFESSDRNLAWFSRTKVRSPWVWPSGFDPSKISENVAYISSLVVAICCDLLGSADICRYFACINALREACFNQPECSQTAIAISLLYYQPIKMHKTATFPILWRHIGPVYLVEFWLRFAGIYVIGWDLPRFAEICWDLAGSVTICWDSLGSVVICRDLLGIAEICWNLLGSARICWDFPRFAEICRDLTSGDLLSFDWDLVKIWVAGNWSILRDLIKIFWDLVDIPDLLIYFLYLPGSNPGRPRKTPSQIFAFIGSF